MELRGQLDATHQRQRTLTDSEANFCFVDFPFPAAVHAHPCTDPTDGRPCTQRRIWESVEPLKGKVANSDSAGVRGHSGGRDGATHLIDSHLVGVVNEKRNVGSARAPAWNNPSMALKNTANEAASGHGRKPLGVFILCPFLSVFSTDRLSLSSNQKFIQSCSGSPRPVTPMRSPPRSTQRGSNLAIESPCLRGWWDRGRSLAILQRKGFKKKSGRAHCWRNDGRGGKRCSGNKIRRSFQLFLKPLHALQVWVSTSTAENRSHILHNMFVFFIKV